MPANLMRRFTILVLGQSTAVLGSSLMGFSLGVWAYQKAGSVTDFTTIAIATSLPAALLSPLAGTLIDRWNRKAILIASQLATITITLVLSLLYRQNMLEIWQISALSALGSLFSAFAFPAMTASIPLMVETKDLSRANSLISLLIGVVQLIAPAIAGTLMVAIGLENIFILNLCGYFIGMCVLISTPIPQPPQRDQHDPLYKRGLFQGMIYGWRYMSAKPGMSLLNLWTAALAFNGFAIVSLITPVVLGFSDAKGLGIVASSAGLGMLVGSLLMLGRGTTSRNMLNIMVAGIICCCMYIVAPLVQAVWYLAICVFIVMASIPVINICGQVIFQRKIAPEFQGRVAGLRNFLRGMMQPLALLTIGPLVDNVFGPAMKKDGSLSGLLGPLLGTGDGRGAALLIFLLGWLSLIWMVMAWFSPIRKIEQILPNHDYSGASP